MFVSVKSSDADTVVYSVFVIVSAVTVVSDAASVAVSCFNSSSDIMRPVKDNIFVKIVLKINKILKAIFVFILWGLD